MKYIRYSILILLCAALQHGQAQVVNQLKSFYFRYGFSSIPFAYYDSVVVEGQVGDTLKFRLEVPHNNNQNQVLKQSGNKIFNEKGQLLYDYNLVVGDTFRFPNGLLIDTFIVDSVYNKAFRHRTHKVWRLNRTNDNYPNQLHWVQGLGSLFFGWDYSNYGQSDGVQQLVAWCLHDSLLMWDSATLKFYKLSETCNFKAFKKQLTVEPLVSSDVNMYPVPVVEVLNIELGGTYTGRIEVFDLYGKCILMRDFESQEQMQVQLPAGGTELLMVRISGAGLYVVKKILR